MTVRQKEELLYKIDDILKYKTIGEYHSHTFTDSLYITEKTYKRVIKNNKLNYYIPGNTRSSQKMIEIYISNNGISVSTYNYYLSITELSVQELLMIYKTMQKECHEER